jgi:hypothetical protein
MTPDWLKQSLVDKFRLESVYEIYDQLYEGKLTEFFADERMQSHNSRHDAYGYYQFNFARVAVDAPMERTKVSGIVCADGKARTILDAFWADNECDFESQSAHQKAFEFGNSVAVVMPNEIGELELYVHDPRDFYVAYDPAKPRKIAYAIHTYIDTVNDGNDLFYICEVYTPFLIQKYVSEIPIVNNMFNVQNMDLRLAEEIDTPIPGMLPVFHFRTERTPVGRSRLDDLESPQRALNDCVTSLMASVRRAGYGQRWLTYENEPAVGDAFSTSSAPGSEEVTQDKYVSGPDTIWTFGGKGIQVGNFDVSASSNFLDAINDIINHMAKISDVPTHYFTTGADAPSGQSYRQGERPLLAVIESAQSMFETTWSKVFEYVLAYYGMTAEATVSWQKMVADDRDFWDTQIAKRQLGVPDTVLLVESGYDQKTIDEWNIDKQNTAQNNTDNAPVNIVDKINADVMLNNAD